MLHKEKNYLNAVIFKSLVKQIQNTIFWVWIFSLLKYEIYFTINEHYLSDLQERVWFLPVAAMEPVWPTVICVTASGGVFSVQMAITGLGTTVCRPVQTATTSAVTGTGLWQPAQQTPQAAPLNVTLCGVTVTLFGGQSGHITVVLWEDIAPQRPIQAKW